MVKPFVSIIIPCRNEELFISGCIKSLLLNDYPQDRVEILVIYGSSKDRTLEIINSISEIHSSVKVLQNKKKIFPAAVNIGIEQATGDFVFIAGAHAGYETSYISKCIENIIEYNADNVGGVLLTEPVSNSFTARMITAVLSSPFGVGNSRFRTGSDKPMETDTVFGGCYRKNVFEKFGMFNEDLISTSDYEFNKRIKRAGARIFLIPGIKVTYYTRSTLLKFFKNNIRNGIWAIYPIALTDHFPVSLRHLIPLVFITSLSGTIWLSLYNRYFTFLLLFISSIYLIAAVIFSIRSAGKKYHYVLLMPFFFLGLHLTYGIGSLTGVIKAVYKKIK
jgi:glycosyltransferase involved in cell wall biosynthesis